MHAVINSARVGRPSPPADYSYPTLPVSAPIIHGHYSVPNGTGLIVALILRRLPILGHGRGPVQEHRGWERACKAVDSKSVLGRFISCLTGLFTFEMLI